MREPFSRLDLSYESDHEPNGMGRYSYEHYIVWPRTINVGWIDSQNSYSREMVEPHLIHKIKEMLFLGVRNVQEENNAEYPLPLIELERFYSRGLPVPCPVCGESQIELNPDDLTVYRGPRTFTLGVSELVIPSLQWPTFFVAPSLIYHYIVDHGYCPPKSFIDAVDAFDFARPLPSRSVDENPGYIVPASEIGSLTAESVFSYPRYVEEDYWDFDEQD